MSAAAAVTEEPAGVAPVDYAASARSLRRVVDEHRPGQRGRVLVPPGAYRDVRSWRSRDHFLGVVVDTALMLRRDAVRNQRIAPDTFRAYMRTIAEAADHTTGRSSELSDETIAERMSRSTRHVRRCRQAAEELQLLKVVDGGRHMTRQERLEAWRAGSTARGLTNIIGLHVPDWLLPHLTKPAVDPKFSTGEPPAQDTGKDDVHPPSFPSEAREGTGTATTIFAADAARTGAPRPAHDTKHPHKSNASSPTVANGGNRAGYRTARQLVTRVLWLRGTEPGRLAARLAKFERAGWSANHIAEAIDAIHARLGWTSPSTSWLRTPAHNLLGWYLDQLDPHNDHPHATFAARTERRRDHNSRRYCRHCALPEFACQTPVRQALDPHDYQPTNGPANEPT